MNSHHITSSHNHLLLRKRSIHPSTQLISNFLQNTNTHRCVHLQHTSRKIQSSPSRDQISTCPSQVHGHGEDGGRMTCIGYGAVSETDFHATSRFEFEVLETYSGYEHAYTQGTAQSHGTSRGRTRVRRLCCNHLVSSWSHARSNQ